MKRTAFALILVILFNFLAPFSIFAAQEAPGFALSADEESYLASIKDRPVSLAITSELSSFVNSQGEKSGLLQPLIGLMEDRWGLTVETVNPGWNESFNRLNAGEIDLLGPAILSEERRGMYYSTEALYNANMDIYTHGDTPFDSIVDMQGKTVGLLSNSALPEMLDVYLTPEGNIKYYQTIEELISALEQGEVFCAAVALTIQSELLEHSDVHYEMSVESVVAPQCIYSNSERMVPLIDLINRYLASSEGKAMIGEINANRRKCTLEKYREFYKDDIDYVKGNYDKLRIFDSGMLYPLSYVQNAKHNGLQDEINDIISELTGVPVEVLDYSGLGKTSTAVDALKKGEVLAAAGIYRANEHNLDDSLAYSLPLMVDTLSFYVKQTNTMDSLSDMRIGSLDFSHSYINWKSVVRKSPEIYASRGVMIEDLRKNKLDAVFIGEMMTDYYYTVLNDYSLKRFGNFAVPASVHMLYSAENKSFNRLMDAAIKLQVMTDPESRWIWNNRSQNSKFEVMRLRDQMDLFRMRAVAAAVFFIVILIILLFFVVYQLIKFRNFDRQISRMLSVQGNADMFWGNLKTNRLISKGDYPISKKLGFSQDAAGKLVDMDSLKKDIARIDEQGLEYYARDIEVKSEDSDTTCFFRRFTHKINESEFMVYIMDFTAEKYREQELSELANTDYLTKLLNRRAMDELLSEKAANLPSDPNKVFMFMLDIDNFKHINDSYGHHVGDKVLVLAARVIENILPAGNIARWGGEEFLCVAEFESMEEAVGLAQKILYDFESAEVTVGKEKRFYSTISCGISELAKGEAYLNAVRRADKAMYQAKCDGKNCIRFIGAQSEIPDHRQEYAETIDVSVTYNRVMSRAVQAFFHGRDIDAVIMELLKIAVECSGLDRAYVLERTDKDVFERTYVYDPENLESAGFDGAITIDEIKALGYSALTDPMFVSNVNGTISEAEIALRANGLKSFAQLPIFANGRIVGLTGFDNCREAHEWTDDERRILNDMAVILGEVVVRKSLERKLMFSNAAMTSILESIEDIVYVVDFETKKFLYANKKAHDSIKNIVYYEKTCWEVFRPDLSGPCDYCGHKQLLDENGEPVGKSVRHEAYHSLMDMWFDVTDALIDWEDGKKAVVMVCHDITAKRKERLQLQNMLADLEQQKAMLDFAFENSRSFSWILSTDLKTITFGATIENTLGYSAEYFENSFEKYMQLTDADEFLDTIEALHRYINGDSEHFTSEYRIKAADGQIKWLLVRGEICGNNIPMISGVAIDITERKNFEAHQEELLDYLRNEEEKQKLLLAALQSQEVKTTLALEGANSYSWEYIPSLDKLILSRTAEPALGYPIDYFDQKHSRYMESVVFSYAAKTAKKMTAYIDGLTDIYTAEYPMITANGEIKWYLARGKYADDRREVIYGVCIDITESKQYEQRLSERAYKDQLTGLYNKQYLSDGLIKPVNDYFNNFGGVLLDVKSFKNINEAFGYDYGDRIIESITGRLREIFSGKLIIRTSGNRFLAIFENTSIKILEDYAKRVLCEFERPILTDGQMVGIDFRIGIAVRSDADVTKLLEDTEIALYSAKESLTRSYCILSDDVRLSFRRKVNMEFELRAAIERQEFVMYYQPKISTDSKQVIGAEALIRWKHPEIGIVPPLDFIPLAEETGLIIPIGEFVIHEVAEQLRQWLDEGLDIFLSFNLSAKQFLSPQLKSHIRDVLAKYGIPKHGLVIEITESVMISDFDYVKQMLNELGSFGIGVSLDDFGTGYSSMNYLGKIPLDYLKIDKSFIDNATTVIKERAILESIVTMSHKLGFKVTAEGVETAEQLKMLEELDCDIIQGFYFSKPLPKEEFETFIRSTGFKESLK